MDSSDYPSCQVDEVAVRFDSGDMRSLGCSRDKCSTNLEKELNAP
jgi:nicotinic acid phosphoribosyltransferase